ncbi:hypothetical protein EJB05_12563, partial [Eragrostis curvula]
MQLGSDRRLFPPPPAPQGVDNGDGEDRISGLPEELLLDVLRRLGCVREAARTSVLSHRWRDLWTELRELRIDGTWAPTRLRPRFVVSAQISAASVSGSPGTTAGSPSDGSPRCSAQLPGSRRRRSWLAPIGELTSLKLLNLKVDSCDLGVLLPRCPRLRKLLVDFMSFTGNTVTVESKSLEELNLGFRFTTGRIGVLEEFWLQYCCEYYVVGFGEKWRLFALTMETQWSDWLPRVRVHNLHLSIVNNSLLGTTFQRSFAQEVARLPVNGYSVLELRIATEGHDFGPLMLHLFRIRTSIHSLKLILTKNKLPNCPENYGCNQDNSWRNERISLPDLQDVEIHGFSAADHVVDVVQLVFGSAPMLKRINVTLSDEISPSDRGCKKLRSIFEAHASVKCKVYNRSGDAI